MLLLKEENENIDMVSDISSIYIKKAYKKFPV